MDQNRRNASSEGRVSAAVRCTSLRRRVLPATTVTMGMLLILGGVGLAWAVGRVRCEFCRNDITGHYRVYRLEGSTLTVCETCNRRYPHCQLCGLPFREPPVNKGGRILCSRCAAEALTCSLCGRLIQGTYTVYSLGPDKLVVCGTCANTAPRCSACERPLRSQEGILSGRNLLCPQCDHDLLLCEACGQKIIGVRYMLRFRPNEFCESCWKNRPVCSMCGAPCDETPTRLTDGRTLCGRCKETAVTDPKKLAEILAKVQPFLEKELGKPVKRTIRLRLVGPEEIDKMPPTFRKPKPSANSAASSGTSLDEAWGNPEPTPTEEAAPASGKVRRVDSEEGRGPGEKELGKFVRQGDKFEIRILSGQPEDWAWETVAHEFAHAWQSEYNPRLNDSAWEEGFAQWAAEMVLNWQNDAEVAERLRLRKDFYGQAFRMVNHYEAVRGKEGVLHAVLTLTNEAP